MKMQISHERRVFLSLLKSFRWNIRNIMHTKEQIILYIFFKFPCFVLVLYFHIIRFVRDKFTFCKYLNIIMFFHARLLLALRPLPTLMWPGQGNWTTANSNPLTPRRTRNTRSENCINSDSWFVICGHINLRLFWAFSCNSCSPCMFCSDETERRELLYIKQYVYGVYPKEQVIENNFPDFPDFRFICRNRGYLWSILFHS